MAYSIVLTSSAKKNFARLPEEIREQVVPAIDELRDFSQDTAGIVRLKTPFPGYRKRVGDYQILFVAEAGAITIYAIKHHRDAYR